MIDIFVRAFSDNYSNHNDIEPETHNPNIRIIIDTETTIDQYCKRPLKIDQKRPLKIDQLYL